MNSLHTKQSFISQNEIQAEIAFNWLMVWNGTSKRDPCNESVKTTGWKIIP